MRQRNYQYSALLISLYASVLMGVAAYFLAPGKLQPHFLQDDVPIVFMLRFGTFWFCSFVLAILVYLFQVRRQSLAMSKLDRHRVVRFGAYAFSLGTLVAAVVASTLFLMTFV